MGIKSWVKKTINKILNSVIKPILNVIIKPLKSLLKAIGFGKLIDFLIKYLKLYLV